ncbi:hypothetical protein ACHAWC_004117 [Mediolabrus comicus]
MEGRSSRRFHLFVATVLAAIPWLLLSSKDHYWIGKEMFQSTGDVTGSGGSITKPINNIAPALRNDTKSDDADENIDDAQSAATSKKKHNDDNTYQKDNEQWNQIKQLVCPKQVPNPMVWPILFEQARKELGFDLQFVPNTESDKEFVKNFYMFSSGGIGLKSNDGEHHLVYLTVWKGANAHIRENINKRTNLDDRWEFQSNIVDMMKFGHRDFSELWSPIPISKRNQTCVVTAVRDPIEHFLSGYNEMEFRSTPSFHTAHRVQPDGQERQYERYKYGNEARFERYVSDFVWSAPSTGVYPSNPFSNIFHTYSMCGILWVLKEQADLFGVNAPTLTSYLPSISNVSSAFPNLVNTNCHGFDAEFNRPFTSNRESHHPSGKDEDGFYAAAKRVWSKQDATSRALCALHLMDYACFDLIPVPDLCQDVFSDTAFNEMMITNATKKISPSPNLTEDRYRTNNVCSFCERGIPDPELVVPGTGEQSCSSIKAMTDTETFTVELCETIQKDGAICCPDNEQDTSMKDESKAKGEGEG